MEDQIAIKPAVETRDDLDWGVAKHSPVTFVNAETCPDCGAGMIRQSGCSVCPGCGYGCCG